MKKIITPLLNLTSLIILLTSFFVITAQAKDVTNINSNKHGIALDGHDVVAYFNKGQKKAVSGLKNFSTSHKGGTYYFSSNENLVRFKSNPEKYLPAYGGYCAWAVEESSKFVPVDYDTFSIEKDKDGTERLLLFYNKFFINTKSKWNKKSAESEAGSTALINTADTNWLKMLSIEK